MKHNGDQPQEVISDSLYMFTIWVCLATACNINGDIDGKL